MNADKRPIPSASKSFQLSHPRVARSKRSLRYRSKQESFRSTKWAIAVESSVKLTVYVLLGIIASTTIAKLVPYHQTQRAQLTVLQDSVAKAKEKNSELRSQFDRNFDPAQTSQIMQEQSGMGYPNQKKIIWTKPQ